MNWPKQLYFDKSCKGKSIPIAIAIYYKGKRNKLKNNQCYYGFDGSSGAWNLIVTKTKCGKFITKHYMKHLNGKEVYSNE